jgi:HAE1 family hydrophobic/amphiphilic exporter-1
MAVFAVIVLGGVSFFSIPLTLMPDFSYPEISVRTPMAGASPAEIETYITRRLEENLSIINNVTSIESKSTRGMSELLIKFSWDTNLDIASLELREKIQQTPLPKEADAPQILKFDPSAAPVIELALTSSMLDFSQLKLLAENEIKAELLQIPDTAMVLVSGGEEEAVEILLDEKRCAGLGIDISDVVNIIKNQDIDLVGGQVSDGDTAYTVRTQNRVTCINELEDLVISKKKDGAFIRLKDAASLSLVYKNRIRSSRVNRKECVSLSVYKQGDANIVKVAEKIKKSLPAIKEGLKKQGYNKSDSLEIKVTGDQSEFIERAVKEVIDSGIAGALIAVLILFIFLGKAGPTLSAGFCIPVSVIAAFMIMHLQNITFNIMSLGGLALGAGMLVDNSIVVLETIYRYIEKGLSPYEAALRGTSSVAGAVTASTVTNIAVFFPVVFVQGMAGRIFRDLSLTVTYSLTASLIVSLTLIPCSVVFISHLSGFKPKKAVRIVLFIPGLFYRGLVYVSKVVHKGLIKFSGAYEKWLTDFIKNPAICLIIIFFVLWGGFFCAFKLQSSLLPQVQHYEFYIDITLPQGSVLKNTCSIIEKIENIVDSIIGPQLKGIASSAGYQLSSTDKASIEAENIAQIRVTLKNAMLTESYMEKCEKELGKIPGMLFNVSKPSIIEIPPAFELAVYGIDLTRLDNYTSRVFDVISNIPGIVNPVMSLKSGAPLINYRVNRQASANYGVTVQQILDTLKHKIKGVTALELPRGRRKIDVIVKNRLDSGGNDPIEGVYLILKDKKIPLSALVSKSFGLDRALISRAENSRVNYIRSEIRGRPLSEITRAVRKKLDNINFEPGYYADIKGMEKDMKDSLDSLKFAALLAMILVYMAMASQFESFLNPVIIMFSMPFSLAGAGYFLFFTGDTISIVTAIGAVMLCGITVNNGIVLVDAAITLEREGKDSLTAVVQAARARLRPILMTTMTSVFGLIPMALSGGPGSELRASMARTVIGGLSLSTLLTLIVIPYFYYLLNKKLSWGKF